MTAIAWVDGAPASSLPLSLVRALFYGDAVFETMRVESHAPVLCGAHVDRLLASARTLHLTSPLSTSALSEELTRCASELGSPSGVLRVLLARTAPMGLSLVELAPAVRVVIGAPTREHNVSRPNALAVSTHHGPLSALPSHKTPDYLSAMLALDAVRGAADDVLVVDGGVVRGGATSNVFLVESGSVVTPPRALGLAGITALAVTSLAMDHGIAVVERPFGMDEVRAASECFLTSSLRGVVAVGSLDGDAIGSGGWGPITTRLQAAYEAGVHSRTLAISWQKR